MCSIVWLRIHRRKGRRLSKLRNSKNKNRDKYIKYETEERERFIMKNNREFFG